MTARVIDLAQWRRDHAEPAAIVMRWELVWFGWWPVCCLVLESRNEK